MSLGHPRRFGARGQKLRAPRSHGLSVSVGDMWARLADAIAQIQRHNISRLSYEEHYRYAYNLVLNQQGDMLYAGVARLVEAHVAHLVAQHLVPAFPLDAAATDAAREDRRVAEEREAEVPDERLAVVHDIDAVDVLEHVADLAHARAVVVPHGGDCAEEALTRRDAREHRLRGVAARHEAERRRHGARAGKLSLIHI